MVSGTFRSLLRRVHLVVALVFGGLFGLSGLTGCALAWMHELDVALNPIAVEGQMAGSVVQGIGWALMEGFDYDHDGRLRNASLLDYRMPTALDVPPIECVIIETPVPGVPYGVRGVGEVPIVPPAAAIANAIARATGVRILQMPMTPERVLRALRG